MDFLNFLNSDFIMPAAMALVIFIYVFMRIRNNKKYKR